MAPLLFSLLLRKDALKVKQGVRCWDWGCYWIEKSTL